LFIHARTSEITNLLKAWGSGDEAALARLTEHVYPELRVMARRYMKNQAEGNSLQATALVHEVYLRLVDVTNVEWKALCVDKIRSLEESTTCRIQFTPLGVG
jgi:hypothetical protein